MIIVGDRFLQSIDSEGGIVLHSDLGEEGCRNLTLVRL